MAALTTTARDRFPRKRFRITRGPWDGLVALLPDPRDAADHWLTPAWRANGLRIVRDAARTAYVLPVGGAREDAEPLDVNAEADRLAALVAAMPDRPDAEVYTDLRRLLDAEPDKARAWLLETVRATRRNTGRLPAPRPEAATRRAPLSASARSSAYRDRKRERQAETAREWLDVLDADDWADWGGAVSSADLWEAARDGIAEWVDEGEAEEADAPSRYAFLAVAAEVLDRRRTRHGYVFAPRAA